MDRPRRIGKVERRFGYAFSYDGKMDTSHKCNGENINVRVYAKIFRVMLFTQTFLLILK